MTTQILMPTLSPTMTEGTLAKWNIAIGDEVKPGDIIAEVETDKVTIEMEAENAGFVQALNVAEGDEGIAIDSVIAVLSTTPVSAPTNSKNTAQTSSKETAITEEVLHKQPEAAAIAAARSTTAQVCHESSANPLMQNKVNADVDISPLARRIANIAQIDLQNVTGTGAKGRIVKRDIEALFTAPEPESKQDNVFQTSGQPTVEINRKLLPDAKELPVNGMRKTIANKLTESSRDIPHFHMTLDCELDDLLTIRKQLNAELPEGKISVNDMLMKAVALALMAVPEANTMWAGDKILQFEQVDIAMAVAVEQGLVTPVLRNVNDSGLQSISTRAKQLAEKARNNGLVPEDYQGGTFTISNLGMYGIREFTSIINPPQNGILSVGVAEKRPVVKNDALAVATVMSLTLAMDHRCVDGMTGAQLLNAIKGFIEKPYSLML